jgi:hypothetical protein
MLLGLDSSAFLLTGCKRDCEGTVIKDIRATVSLVPARSFLFKSSSQRLLSTAISERPGS